MKSYKILDIEENKILGEYITREAHGEHPAGSKCTAMRQNHRLYLVFVGDDNRPDVVNCPCYYFAEGLEPPAGKYVQLMFWGRYLNFTNTLTPPLYMTETCLDSFKVLLESN